LIDQGAVKIDGERIHTYDLERRFVEGRLIQAGKRQFLRVELTG
jgi:tyrosyl-tRNA synthetase